MQAYREWRLIGRPPDWQPIVQSTYRPNVWDSPFLEADQLPELPEAGCYGTLHGIHAVLDGRRTNMLTARDKSVPWGDVRVLGAVDLWGVVQEHMDGVLRGQFCRVLALRAIVTPLDYPCCGRVLIIRYSDASLPADHARFSRACRYDYQKGPQCGERPALPSGATVLGETTIDDLDQRLRAYYEVRRLPDAGPWFLPVLPPAVVDDE